MTDYEYIEVKTEVLKAFENIRIKGETNDKVIERLLKKALEMGLVKVDNEGNYIFSHN